MRFRDPEPARPPVASVSRMIGLSAIVLMMAAAAYAQHEATPIDQWPNPVAAIRDYTRGPVYIIPGKPEAAILYYDGSVSELDTYDRWGFMCGSDLTGLTFDDLKRCADAHLTRFVDGPDVIIDAGIRGAGIDIAFYADATVPAGALDGLALAETYLESLFADEIMVVLNVSYESISALGATSTYYRDNESYNNTRNGLQAGMDADDVIQSWLPDGFDIPVRYNGSSSTVTSENRIDWPRAAYNATIGGVSALAGNMAISTQVTWDYDPSDGVGWNRFSFVDVVCHETGHALGFVSAVDDLGDSMKTLDIYRFQRTDGTGTDYNPDTYEEFQTAPRLADFNNPDGEHISDLIDATYRMEDGDPWQASHFRLYSDIGIMGPAFEPGTTRYPDYYTAADIDMFDAIGYDFVYCPVTFTSQPEPSQAVCAGDNATLSVQVLADAPAFQWRRGTTDLVDDGAHIFGATTSTLLIVGFTPADEADDYNCMVTNTLYDCSEVSNNAQVYIDIDTPVFITQPVDREVTEGESAAFYVALADPFLASYQWYRNGTPLADDGRIFGSASDTLLILTTELGDAGQYDCVATSILGAECSLTSDAATLIVNPAGGDDCPEDLDGDETIGLGDLSTLLASYGGPGDAADGDFDGDGFVDLADLAVLLAVYGQDCPTR